MFHLSKMKAAMEEVADASELHKTCTLNCFHVIFWQQQQLRKYPFQTDLRYIQTSWFSLLFMTQEVCSRVIKSEQPTKKCYQYSKTSIKTSMAFYYSRTQEWDKSIFSYKMPHNGNNSFWMLLCVLCYCMWCCPSYFQSAWTHCSHILVLPNHN